MTLNDLQFSTGDDIYTIGITTQYMLYYAKLTLCSDHIEFTRLFDFGIEWTFDDYIVSC
jgi:hypothetical protein